MKGRILVLLAALLFLFGCETSSGPKGKEMSIGTSTVEEEGEDVVQGESGPLRMEDYLEDYDYVVETIKENFPYLEMNERKTGVSFQEEGERLRLFIDEKMNILDFEDLLTELFYSLNNDHLEVFYSDEKPWALNAYLGDDGKIPYFTEQVNQFRKPRVMERYGLTEEDFVYRKEEIRPESAGFSGEPGNLKVQLLPGNVAYGSIREMLSPEFWKEDVKTWEEFWKKEKPSAWILDLRGNTGGDSRYYTDFILPYFYEKPGKMTYFLLYKDGDLCRNLLRGMREEGEGEDSAPKDLLGNIYDRLPSERVEFHHGVRMEEEVRPGHDVFTGPLFLLVDKEVFSSAEVMAMFLQETKRGVLLGEVTGGDGLGLDPALFALPKTGLVLRMPLDYGVTSEGRVPEETGTVPDILVKGPWGSSLERDPCIKKVYELLEKKEKKVS